ncbi:bifunctional 3-demethylubiquinone-9 3-methyltransferase/ 2-octaprenyl-6-hydroxy phenol methylase [Rubripirellula reticaptiva]|uniref:Bifunctional 3-demethylubiquinone-9 3-methyltransferase/ 2-octaprenyl-6-hydroxy phenol methylase n=1 Tax=Rubripirellula reticaptiva TaxID=2528013 RepID=A0A5C6EGZ5_9BACT|nr:class I SAM-dependent methyltransferase [Rubripirellula reticaptiva]TWU47715.1 bifunctional 3-demethylubiquinone-9 3-methyltransferase/ 2-octaprenyl-6-hydroxy phenol methylase [Rubripirellula reticaptiva]
MQSTAKVNLECPVCGVTQFRHRFKKKNRAFWQCQSCDMELQYPLPTADELRDYYDNSYSEGMYNEFASAQTMKRMTAGRRLLEIRRHLPIGGQWLDVGCADGMFIDVANANGVNVEGVELSQVAVDLARNSGLKVHCGTIDSLPEDRMFDTITAFDVLEHVLDPV